MISHASNGERLIFLDVIPDHRYGIPARTVYKLKVGFWVPIGMEDSGSVKLDPLAPFWLTVNFKCVAAAV
jgi:hypothetical protein